MNTKAIADAIAGRFAGITAGGEAIAVGPTASLPNAITRGPALLVRHPTGEYEGGPSQTRTGTLTFPVQLLRDPLDVPGRSDALYAWLDAMMDRVELDADLGIPTVVANAFVIASRAEIDGESYAGALFDVVELTVAVTLYEIVPAWSP